VPQRPQHPSPRAPVVLVGAIAVSLALAGACSAGSTRSSGTGSAGGSSSFTQSAGSGGLGGSSSSAGGAGGAGSGIFNIDASLDAPSSCPLTCSSDFHSVIDCNGTLVQMCTGTQGCDLSTGSCGNACQAAVNNKNSVGCEYYATNMDQFEQDVCFAAFVANTWDTPAHIVVDFQGNTLPIANFARIPSGAGPTLTYGAYDATTGLAPGEVAILFLAGTGNDVPCPAGVTTAMPSGSQIFNASGIGASFHITTDVPVVSYEINPYGGGSAAVTGASLLLPTSVWDLNYVAVTVTPHDIASPSMNIIATLDNTEVTMLPTVAVQGGGSLPAGLANMPYTFKLNAGQQAQFTQEADLTGSIIQATNPIGFMAGQPCMREPVGTAFCDHGEQMVPPVKALGNEYVGVMFRPRATGDQAIWHLIGAVDGTTLTYSSAVGGPATLAAGQVVDFITAVPFVVTSQDTSHPFLLFTYMSGSQWMPSIAGSNMQGYGDPDFVLSVPPQQYLSDYVFFTDPTYPETNLVIVRAPDENMNFQDVTLDCVTGPLTGWTPVGAYEWTRVDLSRHNFVAQGNCSNGAHEMKSTGRFGLWVWGWGSPETTTFTANVSYGYPGGMNVQPINTVIIPPTPQ
jgi:IgGFc binding protein